MNTHVIVTETAEFVSRLSFEGIKPNVFVSANISDAITYSKEEAEEVLQHLGKRFNAVPKSLIDTVL